MRACIDTDHRIPVQKVALPAMLRPWAASLQGAAAVVVIDSGDHRSRQAVVRLAHVFDLPVVYHCCSDKSTHDM